MSTTKKTPYDFIQRNYRDPGGDDPIKRWLPHPENARVICAALYANGLPEQELEDGRQDVFLRALTAFKRGARPPKDLREMKAFCAAIARRYAKATYRMNARRARLGHAGICEADADEYAPLEFGDATEQRDPAEAGIQLEKQLQVLAQLFRDGRMPERALDILEGIAFNRSHKEIAKSLGVTDRVVEGRMRTMLRNLRKKSGRFESLPGMDSLRAIVATPGAIDALRRTA